MRRSRTTTPRGNAPGPVKARPETKKPGDYADLITGGLISLAQALAGFGMRKPAARIAQNAEATGKNLDRLAQEDKRVARFLEWVTTPGVWGAALAPVVAIAAGCAVDSGALVGTPAEHFIRIKPLTDQEADEILEAHDIEPPAEEAVRAPMCPAGDDLTWTAHWLGTVPDCATCSAALVEERARAG